MSFGALLAVFLSAISTLPAPSEPGAVRLRDVRVLIGSDLERIRLRCGEPLRVRDVDNGATRVIAPAPDGGWVELRPPATGGVRIGRDTFKTSSVVVAPPSADGTIDVALFDGSDYAPGRAYPGSLVIERRSDGLLDVIDRVDVERYVGCVVANEAWPGFHEETYRAQAILSRSYVLYHMMRRGLPRFDVSATQGSQVYRGVRTDDTGRRAAEAARYTRGMVLTWDGDGVERLFCAYYSAVCGGVSQSASLFGAEGDIAPLAGGVACDYCSIAPGDTYRWGTVKLSRQEIGRRLTARYPDRFAPGAVRRVEVIERDRWGRVLRLRIVDAAGAEHEMLAERFRLAIGADDVRSTHFSVRSSGASTVFVEGRGFGHGLGACQWGLEGQARQGRRAGEMLRYYFPGATLTRVY